MKKLSLLLASVIMTVFASSLYADSTQSSSSTFNSEKPFRISPVVTLSAGAAFTGVGAPQDYYDSNIKQYAYFNSQSSSQTKALLGAFIGAEIPFTVKLPFHTQSNLYSDLIWQFGVGYYEPYSSYRVAGITSQGSGTVNPKDYYYSYNVRSRQLLFENKLLTTLHDIYHPYFYTGLGAGFNSAYTYQTSPTKPPSPSIATFANRTATAFSYAVGVGIDVDIKWISHLPGLRAGIGYRFADLGNTSLGEGQTTAGNPRQTLSSTPQQSHLYSHELLVQLSYVI